MQTRLQICPSRILSSTKIVRGKDAAIARCKKKPDTKWQCCFSKKFSVYSFYHYLTTSLIFYTMMNFTSLRLSLVGLTLAAMLSACSNEETTEPSVQEPSIQLTAQESEIGALNFTVQTEHAERCAYVCINAEQALPTSADEIFAQGTELEISGQRQYPRTHCRRRRSDLCHHRGGSQPERQHRIQQTGTHPEKERDPHSGNDRSGLQDRAAALSSQRHADDQPVRIGEYGDLPDPDQDRGTGEQRRAAEQ